MGQVTKIDPRASYAFSSRRDSLAKYDKLSYFLGMADKLVVKLKIAVLIAALVAACLVDNAAGWLTEKLGGEHGE